MKYGVGFFAASTMMGSNNRSARPPGLFSGYYVDYEEGDQREENPNGNDYIRSVVLTTVKKLPDYAFPAAISVTLLINLSGSGAIAVFSRFTSPVFGFPLDIRHSMIATAPPEEAALKEKDHRPGYTFSHWETTGGKTLDDPVTDRRR